MLNSSYDSTSGDRPSLRVLYLFAGPARRSDVRASLELICKAHDVSLVMSEIDICRDPSMDLLDSAIATRCLTEIQNSEWDVVWKAQNNLHGVPVGQHLPPRAQHILIKRHLANKSH